MASHVHAYFQATYMIWFFCLLSAPAALGHGFITSIKVGEAIYPGPYTNASLLQSGLFTNQTMAARNAPSDKGWVALPTLPEIACSTAGTPATDAPKSSIEMLAGDVVTLTITGAPGVAFYHGPCLMAIDMANCHGDCGSADASTLNWFRLQVEGYAGGTFAMFAYELATDYRTDGSGAGPEYYFVVPQDLVSGSYLIRYEVACLWQAYDFQKVQPLAPAYPQFYPWCIQATVQSNGTTDPPGQLITSYYSNSDFTSLPLGENDTNALNAWLQPGPQPVQFHQTPAASTKQYWYHLSRWAVSYAGTGWDNQGTLPNTCSNDVSASFSFAFTGTGFSYYGSRGSDRGAFKVQIDGEDYAGTAAAPGVGTDLTALYVARNMILGVHWIRISQGGTSGAYLCNNLIEVQGAMLNASRLPTLFSPNTNVRPKDSDAANFRRRPDRKRLGLGFGLGLGLGGAFLLFLAFLFYIKHGRARKKRARESRATIEDREDGKPTLPSVIPYSLDAVISSGRTETISRAPSLTPDTPSPSAISHTVVQRDSADPIPPHSPSSPSHLWFAGKGRFATDDADSEMQAGPSTGSDARVYLQRRSQPSSTVLPEEDASLLHNSTETLPPLYQLVGEARPLQDARPDPRVSGSGSGSGT